MGIDGKGSLVLIGDAILSAAMPRSGEPESVGRAPSESAPIATYAQSSAPLMH